jgi:UDP:flavonoid glycosyltransferase YjiC (YdhE family)
MAQSKVLICCGGSLGELHPFLSLGRSLAKRGVEVHVACDEQFRRYVPLFGLGWLGLDFSVATRGAGHAEQVSRIFSRRGNRIVLTRFDARTAQQMEAIRRGLETIGGADLILGSWLTPAAAIVAERDGIPWVHAHIYPFSVMHPADLPILPESPHGRTAFPKARYVSYFNRQFAHTLALRRELGLPALPATPAEASAAACLELALFPEWLMRAPAAELDRPVLFAGFPEPIRFPATLGPRILNFLSDGSPPILVTLGSALPAASAARHAAVVAAARSLGRRVVIVNPTVAADVFEADVVTLRFASPVALLPHCAASVNHAGINSVAEAMRFGRPMLAIPHAFDQFDNAARVERLGVGRAVHAGETSEAGLASALSELLGDAAVTTASAAVAARVAADDGTAAADAIIGQIGR